VIGALASQLDGQRRDLQLEVVDQLQAGVDGAPPRVGDREPVEQVAAGVPEQIRHRARMPEGHQRRVDTVLERRAMADQVQPVARQLGVCPMFCVRSGVTDAALGAGKAIHDQAEDQVERG
jgi:hypothetical protein